jgi:hypothetical protein
LTRRGADAPEGEAEDAPEGEAEDAPEGEAEDARAAKTFRPLI